MFQEYAVIRLKNIVPTLPIPVGSKGAILIVHERVPLAYEVEFVDQQGKSLGIHTVRDADLIADDPKKRGMP